MLAEIACDESGAEGENLLDGVTDVFAHASVWLPLEEAEQCVRELRARIRSPAEEYKANHLLRGKHRGSLLWLLGSLHGYSGVYLVEKAYFAAVRMADLLGTADAATLYRDRDLLRTFNDLMRGRVSPEQFASLRPEAADLVRHAEAYHQRLPAALPLLDPLIPAIVRAVERWQPALVVHDRQTTLSEDRIAELQIPIRLVASRDDARIQVADFLAGVARKIASGVLNGDPDEELADLLRPYVDPASVWGDDKSWALLKPAEG